MKTGKYYKSASLALLAAMMMFPASSSLALDPADRPEIEKIIREYLLTNPQLMLEVQQALEKGCRTVVVMMAAVSIL